MDKAALLALADRVEAEEGDFEFLSFVFDWFNAKDPGALAECIQCYDIDRAITAAALRAIAGGEDGEV